VSPNGFLSLSSTEWKAVALFSAWRLTVALNPLTTCLSFKDTNLSLEVVQTCMLLEEPEAAMSLSSYELVCE